MIRALLVFSVSCLAALTASTLWAKQNITGIWEGTYDSGKHLTWKASTTELDSVKGFQGQGVSTLHGLFASPGGPGSYASKDAVSYSFKTKIYYKENQLHLIDLSDNPINMLHLVGFPDFFSNLARTHKIPELKELTLPLKGSSEVIGIHKKNSGKVDGDIAYTYEIELDSTFKYQNNQYLSNILILHIDGHFVMETTNLKPKNRREEVTFTVEMPLNRDTDPASWTTEEIEALLVGLAEHPYYDVAWGKKDEEAHRRLPEVIWGGRKEGYQRLMDFAFEKYGVRKPILATFYPDLDVPAQYDRLANAAADQYFVKMGPKAFRHPALYMVSAYVHEYTHYKQYWLTWSKLERETEAYCVQMEWLRDNYSRHPELNYLPLDKLLDEAKNGFSAEPALKGKTLVCDPALGLKRWNAINGELQQGQEAPSPEQMDSQDTSQPARKSGTGKKWDTVLDY